MERLHAIPYSGRNGRTILLLQPDCRARTESTAIEPREKKSIQVWDLQVRVFHWALAFFFGLAYFLEGDRLRLHSHAGYTVALLVLFRVVWGFIGSDRARFVDFVVRPKESLRYLVQLVRGRARSYLGHNPAGAAMIVALLAGMLITALTGMTLYALEGSGPLAKTFVSSWPGDLLEDVHEFFADFSLVLVIVHVTGVLLSSYSLRENLTKAMITGHKNGKGEQR